MFAQQCGATEKTNQCSFMKHSEMSKLVQEHTAKMEGKAIVNELWTLLRNNSISYNLKKVS